MKLEFIGVGEAFDPQYGNTSVLIHSQSKLLIDCGYAVVRNFLEAYQDPDFIDVLYITHWHADHCFGIPPLLTRWREDGRKKPLTLLGQPGTKGHMERLLECGYPGWGAKSAYELHYRESTSALAFNELQLSFALTDHSLQNYAVKIDDGRRRFAVSGDGALTEESKSLYQDVHVLVHEAFGLDTAPAGHTTAREIAAFCTHLPALETLALVHLHRKERQEKEAEFLRLRENVSFKVIVPLPHDTAH